jgi:hypothetical protein
MGKESSGIAIFVSWELKSKMDEEQGRKWAIRRKRGKHCRRALVIIHMMAPAWLLAQTYTFSPANSISLRVSQFHERLLLHSHYRAAALILL